MSFFHKKIENPEKGAFFIPVLIGIGIITALGGATYGAAKWAESAKSDFLKSGVKLIGDLIYGAGEMLGEFSSSLLSQVLTADFMKKAITTNENFLLGWSEVRELSNMLIVLGFIAVGIAFTLRLEGFGTKKVLISLILVALLVNFSGIFCGIFIDGSNIAMDTFLKGGNGIGTDIFNKIASTGQQCAGGKTSGCIDWQNMADSYNVTGYIKAAVSFAVLFVMLAISMFYLSCILIARQAVLAILFILSPIAFTFWVFPFTKKWWSEWWSAFLKWIFIGDIGAFFIYIAWKILSSIKSPTDFDLVIIIIFLFVGFKIAAKNGGAGTIAAGAILGAAKSGVGIAMGAATSGGTVAGMAALNKLTKGGASAAKEKITAGAGRAMERIGLRQQGTTDTAVNKRVEEKAKLVSTAYASARARGDTGTMEKIQRDARTKKGADGAAAMQAIVENKDLRRTFKDSSGKFDEITASGRIDYARSAGAKDIRDKATKQAPTLAAHDYKTIAQIKHDHPAWSQSQARDEAVIRAAAKVPEEELDRDFVDSMDSKTLAAVTARMTTKKKETLKANTRESLMQQIRSMPAGSPEKLSMIKKAQIVIKI